MIELRDREDGRVLGSISEQQLQFLTEQLEEESGSDTDYYLDHATLELLEERGIDAEFLRLLRTALGDREDMEIEWSRR